MLFPRTKLVDTYIEKIEENAPHTVILYWPKWSGKTTFLKLLENAGVLDPRKTEYIKTDINEHETRNHKPKFIVIDAQISYDFSEIRTFIKSQMPEIRIIYVTNTQIPPIAQEEKDIMLYEIPFIGFREFAEWYHHPINIAEIMTGEAHLDRLKELRDMYIHLWSFGENLIKWENLWNFYREKLEEMKQDIFPKEENEFIEFIRTIAMNVWELFKEERIGKMVGITRRKVRKYASILAKHRMIRAVGPFYTDPNTEVTRHTKLYFRDLSFMQSALWNGYYHGETKKWVLENFILLELERKLKDTHTIYFYRKKSGANISFILEENTTKKLTPIEVYLRESKGISQVLKSFDESYHEQVDHSMILNEWMAEQRFLNDLPVIVLPHFAI